MDDILSTWQEIAADARIKKLDEVKNSDDGNSKTDADDSSNIGQEIKKVQFRLLHEARYLSEHTGSWQETFAQQGENEKKNQNR